MAQWPAPKMPSEPAVNLETLSCQASFHGNETLVPSVDCRRDSHTLGHSEIVIHFLDPFLSNEKNPGCLGCIVGFMPFAYSGNFYPIIGMSIKLPV